MKWSPTLILLFFTNLIQERYFCWNVEWHLTPEPCKLYLLLFYGQYVQRSVSFLFAISDQLGFSKRYFGVFKQHLTFCSSFIPWGSICSLIFPYSKIFCLLTFDVRYFCKKLETISKIPYRILSCVELDLYVCISSRGLKNVNFWPEEKVELNICYKISN